MMKHVISPAADLSRYNTLGIPAAAAYLQVITGADQLPEALQFAAKHQLPIFPLGGGSNIVLGQERLECLVLKVNIPGITILEQTDTSTLVRIGAGEDWDSCVAWAVERELAGIESLSLIPGTVGATPVQNVGAYGQEISETLTEIEAFDMQTGELAVLSNADCRFGYRHSRFKGVAERRYIITSVTLRLKSARLASPPGYPSLQAELRRRGITRPTVAQTREAVIAVRRSKLPDPAQVPTAGSFFANPIVSLGKLAVLQRHHPEMPHWPQPGGHVKLAAAWLVEQCGLKGVVENGVGLYDRQAIALVNPGHRSAAEVLAFRDRVIVAVEEKFGVTLAMEPELIKF